MGSDDGKRGTPSSGHVPLEETLARAAARLAAEGKAAKGAMHKADRPAAPTPSGRKGAEPSSASHSTPKPSEPSRASPSTPKAEEVSRASPSSPNDEPSRASHPAPGAAEPPRHSPAARKSAKSPRAAPAERKAAPPAPTARRPSPGRSRQWVAALLVSGLGIGALIWALHDPNTTDPPAPAVAGGAASAVAPAVAAKAQTPAQVALVVKSNAAGARREIIHTVAPGETLWSIAARYTRDPYSYTQLAAHNGITNPDRIRPGDKVRIVFEEEEKEAR